MRQNASSRYQSSLKCLLLGLLALWLSGCATVGWYGQAVRGQVELLCKRQDIAELIADPATPDDLRRQLTTALDAREFAVAELGLPDSRSYTLYADLGRDAAVWNVVAAPRFSMEPKTWCYPFVGCLAYRGYFRPEGAEALARRLGREGHDSAVFPAAAYSTLGWFADPVLDTMLEQDEVRLAGLIFHELAHEKLHVRGDTAFNEAYATFVEREGIRRWLHARGDSARLERWEQDLAVEQAFIDLLLAARSRLVELYGRDLDAERMAEEKAARFGRLRHEYRQFEQRHETRRFRNWFDRPLNNAHLVMVATYESGVSAFRELLGECAGQLSCVHDKAQALADAPAPRRERFLGSED